MASTQSNEGGLSKPVLVTITGLAFTVIALLIAVIVLFAGGKQTDLAAKTHSNSERHLRPDRADTNSRSQVDLGPAIEIDDDGLLTVEEGDTRPLAIAALRTLATKSKHTEEEVEKIVRNRHYIRLAEAAIRTLVPDTDWEDLKDDLDEIITLFTLKKAVKGTRKCTDFLVNTLT